MSIRRRLYNRLYAPIHDVLFNEWDPIGVGAAEQTQDEYDPYIPS